nr:hypothetical protein B13N20.230 [imported] - Neurospora crassa [Neurospora crassa]
MVCVSVLGLPGTSGARAWSSGCAPTSTTPAPESAMDVMSRRVLEDGFDDEGKEDQLEVSGLQERWCWRHARRLYFVRSTHSTKKRGCFDCCVASPVCTGHPQRAFFLAGEPRLR